MRALSVVLSVLLPVSFVPFSRSQPLTISTLAGSPGQGSADGTGAAAGLANPWGVAADSSGNLYVADTDNHTIRRITTDGGVSTWAGLAGVNGSADGTGSDARFYQPQGVAVDSAGNVYVADTGNYTIRKITPDGAVSTLAGSPGMAGSTDASGGNARFYEPEGIGVNSSGTVIYVADTWNHTIRQVTSAGAVTTFAGSAGSFGTNNGTGSSAQFYQPQGIAIDGAGNVYVGDTGNQTIRKITSAGVVTTLAGSAGTYGTGDGTGTGAQFWAPQGLALDSGTNLYVADSFNNTIRKVTPSGVVTTLAGTAGSLGSADGTGAAARFWLPQSIAVDGSGNIYVADSANGTIRQIASGAVVTTLAGSASTGSADGTGGAARFDWPSGAAIDSSGGRYVADTGNSTIRTITPAGVVSTLAGSAGNSGSTDATGSSARFYAPQGVAVDTSGNTYVADTANNTIRKVTSGGVVSTLAGSAGTNGLTDGTGSSALFNGPQGLVVSTSGIIYVADTWNHTIRQVTSAGVVTTLAGLPGYSGSIDGTSAGNGTNTARFYCPSGVAADASGNVYVADTRNHTIRKVTSAGVVSTLAGLAGVWGRADGTNNGARFNQPQGVTVDASGNLYVLDTGNHSIRMVAPTGTNWVVTTVAGTPDVSGSADGSGSTAQFMYPSGIALNNVGAFAVADWGNNTIRTGVSSNIVIVPPAITNQPQGLTINQGTSATFTVGVSGTAPFSYQWLFQGGNITGGTASSYTLTNAQPSDSGSYSVVVANSGGSVTSTPAILTVNPVPTPPGISAQPQNQVVSQGSTAGFSVTATGSTPFSYQWLYSGTALAGVSASSYSVTNAQPANAGSYSVIVTNDYGSITSSMATLTVIVAPLISVQPSNRLASVSNTVTFTVGLSQGTTPAYQWRQNGTPISGATQSSLTLSSILWSSAGTYSAVVSNSAGSQTSAGATLIVQQAAFTFYDGFESYSKGSLDNNTTGGPNTSSANPWWGVNTTVQGWVTNANSGVTPHGGSQMVGTSGVTKQDYLNLLYRMNAGQIYYGNFMCDWWFYDPYGSTASGATNSQEYLAIAQYAPVSTTGDTSTFTTYNQRMSLGAYNGNTGYNYLYYQARIIGGSGTFGSGNSWYNTTALRSVGWHHARIVVGIPNAADYAPISMYVDNMLNATVASGGTNLGYNLIELNHDMASASGTGWYYDDFTFRAANDPWIIEQPGTQSASPGQPASFSTVAVGTGYQWQFNGASIAGATTSSYKITSVAATNFGSYACVITGTNGSITTTQAVLTVTGPPAIVAQPASLTVTQSQDAAFSITPAGTTPLSCQWQFNNAPILGATTTDYAVTSAQSTNAGSYSIIVTNAWGSVTSSVATLTVLLPPSIAAEPISLTVTQGQDATFSVTADGSTPLGFQWQFNAAPIPGAAATNYDVADVQPTDAGSYSVVITNALGSITSSVVTLTVLVAPSITNQPQSQTVLAGTCANFSVAATGSAPLSYQWQWNGAPQASGTLSSYTACNAGSYSVLVSNLAGVTLSDTAILTLTNNPSPPLAGHFDSLGLLGDGSLQLNMSGAPNSNYSLQFTADWTNWTLLATLSGTNGLFQFNDPSVATNTERFYRLQLVP
jgi:sugar lactone lactonase YvrE